VRSLRYVPPGLLLATLALAGCGSGRAGDTCSTDLDCAEGSCIEGICTTCRSSDDCDPGATCLDGWPGGYCALPCQYTATSGADVPVNAGSPSCPRDELVCAQFGEAGQVCLLGCRSDADCGSAYACTDDGYCRPACSSHAQCGSGRSCGPDGTCMAGRALAGEPGAACTEDAQCTSGASPVCARADEGWPGGTCLSSCADTDGGADACPADTLCLVFDEATDSSWCMQSCETNFDCRPEYFCQRVDGYGFCMARCNASSVPFCTEAGMTCEPNSGACVDDTGAGTSVETLDLGTVSVSRNREFGSFAFDVVDDVASFTITVTSDGGGVSVPYRIVAPSGREVFAVERMGSSEMRILAYNEGSFAVLYPNSPRLSVEPGRWKFSLYNQDGGGTARVRVLLKHGPGVIAGGTIDVNAFVVTDEFGANPAGDPRFQEMMTSFEAAWATVGLAVGAVEVIPVTGSERTRWSTIDTIDGARSEFREMIGTLSARAPNGAALNFFFVDAIEAGSEGFIVLGLAAGIPGIPVIPGTDASGVAVSTVAIDPSFGLGGPAGLGTTMAHEGGHWLGLYHTTEQEGTLHDPIPDTLECPASRDSDRSGYVDSRECAGRGAQYLMFWEADTHALEITPNQAYVILRNPAVR
jgi:hypothetical protein